MLSNLNRIPLKPNSKLPAVSWKEYQKEKYTGEIEGNYAVICGKTSDNLVVIDIDKKQLEYIDKILPGALDKTLVVETGGGYHIYLKCIKLPNTLRLQNKDIHIDVQSQGAYVVGPGSIHPDTGKTYAIISNGTVKILEVDFKIIQKRLEKLGFKVIKSKATLEGTEQGNRNDAMFKLSVKMLKEYDDVNTAWALVQTVNDKNRPPLPTQELETLFNSAKKYAFDTGEVLDTPIQKIDTDMYGKKIRFDCLIMAVGPRKAYIKEAEYECPRCKNSATIKCDERRNIIIPKCSNKSCRQELFKVVPESVITEYVQTCILQEPLEEAKNNSPVTFTAKLVGADVGEAFISQKKRITGIFRVDIDDKKVEKDIYIDIIEMEDLGDVKLCVPTDEELKKLKEESKKPDFMDKLCKSYAPTIYGYRDIKECMLLTLVGSHEIKNDKRGWVNMFLVGDPSMAKSKLLEFGNKICQKSIYTSGKGTSAAGLTIGMVKQPDGTSVMMAGVYPMSHKGFAFLDEFDKMSKEDRSSMHEVMEQGKVSRALAGKTVTLPAMVGTLAAANPRFGSYDPTINLIDNLYLPSTILSRFDIIFLMRDTVDDLMDRKKAGHVLKYFTKGTDEEKAFLTPRELSAYLNHVRQLRPKLTPEAGQKLLNVYTKIRKASQKEGLPVSMRQFESLIRLTLMHAKLYFKEVADEDDVEEVIRLVKESYGSMGTKIEITSQGVLFQHTHQTKDQKFIHAWNKCKDTLGLVKLKKIKEYLKEADDWAEEDVEKTFWKFERAGKIIGQPNNLWKWVD